MEGLDKMTDRELALALYEAETSGNDLGMVYAENEVCGRLNISLDETEQGLTPAAADLIDGFVKQHAPELELAR